MSWNVAPRFVASLAASWPDQKDRAWIRQACRQIFKEAGLRPPGRFSILIAELVARALLLSDGVRNMLSPRPRRVRPAPGSHLIRFARLAFSKKTRDNVLLPTIADMREEYLDALKDGAKWQARMARLRGYYAFAKAAGLQRVMDSIGHLFKSWGRPS